MAEGASAPNPPAEGPKHPLRVLDNALFRAEDALIAIFLFLVTVLIFFDVLHRRLTAPESKIGQLIWDKLGIEDAGARATVEGVVAPILTIWVLLGFTWFGF